MKIKVVLLLVLILAFFVSLTGAVNGLLRIEANVTMYKLYVDGVHEMTEGVWCRTGCPSTSAQPDGIVQLEKKLNLLVYGGVALGGLAILLLILFFASRRKGVVEEIPSKPPLSEKKKKAKVPLKTPRKGRIIPIQREKPAAKLCKICEGYLDKPGDLYTCPVCDQVYHRECARRTKDCPFCGKKIEVGEER